jgi:hypothetical protein
MEVCIPVLNPEVFLVSPSSHERFDAGAWFLVPSVPLKGLLEESKKDPYLPMRTERILNDMIVS